MLFWCNIIGCQIWKSINPQITRSGWYVFECFFFCLIRNPFPHTTNLHQKYLKTCRQKYRRSLHMRVFLLYRDENILWQNVKLLFVSIFFLLPQCFQKWYFADASASGKVLIIYNIVVWIVVHCPFFNGRFNRKISAMHSPRYANWWIRLFYRSDMKIRRKILASQLK